ncbi:helix-turn-helix domain-containing protein [Kineococcus esterisolvens]|uniref:helix-turn-helix domain-containing protein n=1 Tax=unclassified Kineococcus TaxID=2621656 RepID=UPI003D7E6E5F
MESTREGAEDLEQVLGRIGPRLRALRTARGLTLDRLAAESGISASTLSRLETGARRPTLDVLIPLARVHRVALDDLVQARTGDPRTHLTPQRSTGGGVVVPLTRYPSRIRVFKHVLGQREVRLRSHAGFVRLHVLAGTARVLVADRELSLAPGEATEFDTTTPHWFGPAGTGTVELLHLFGPGGDQAVVHT